MNLNSQVRFLGIVLIGLCGASGRAGAEGLEEAPAAPEPVEADAGASRIWHLPPTEARLGAALELRAVIHQPWAEGGLVARYRTSGTQRYLEAPFERSSAGGYYARIPAASVQRAGLEYYVAGRTSGTSHFASAAHPHRVRAEPELEARWIEVEKARLGDRRDALETSLSLHNFGDTYGADRLAAGSVDWSHLLVGRLYSIHLGFAFLQGETPVSATEEEGTRQAGARYGYGGVRLRLRDKVWVDGKAMMGFGHKGFVAGVGGALTLGNDWRTAVTIGAETLSEVSYKAWLRLQWDTVPGVLMSATVATTNQPKSVIDTGSYVEFQVRYPLTERFELGGSLSYSARGNRPGGGGAGLRTRYLF